MIKYNIMWECRRCWEEINKWLWCKKCRERVDEEMRWEISRPFEYYFESYIKRNRQIQKAKRKSK